MTFGQIKNKKPGARAPHRGMRAGFKRGGQQFVQRRRQHQAGGKADEQGEAALKQARSQKRQRRNRRAKNQRARRDARHNDRRPINFHKSFIDFPAVLFAPDRDADKFPRSARQAEVRRQVASEYAFPLREWRRSSLRV